MNSTKPKIILIDDDFDEYALFQDAFEELDRVVDVLFFNNCYEFLDHLKKMPDFDLGTIFLDINMPEMGGIDCLKHVRDNPHYGTLKIVMYSTSKDPGMIWRSFKEGADLYIQKPGSFSTLKSILDLLMEDNWEGLKESGIGEVHFSPAHN